MSSGATRVSSYTMVAVPVRKLASTLTTPPRRLICFSTPAPSKMDIIPSICTVVSFTICLPIRGSAHLPIVLSLREDAAGAFAHRRVAESECFESFSSRVGYNGAGESVDVGGNFFHVAPKNDRCQRSSLPSSRTFGSDSNQVKDASWASSQPEIPPNRQRNRLSN